MRKEKRLTWWVPVMGQREKDLLCEVIDKEFPNDGEYTTRFEEQIAEICEVPYAVAVTSGTTAIAVALMACGVGYGDEVIVPDITFIATANAVSLIGATPVLVDVNPETFLIDSAARAITSRTKAIIPVHVSGHPAPMDELLALAEKHSLYIVEDAAEGLGSKWNGKPLGSIGSAGCFSLSPAKTITTGQGGVVVTNDPKIDENLRLLKDQGRPVRGTGGADTHIALGFNFKFTNLQAAMGLAQLEDFQPRLDHQRNLYEWYAQYLPKSNSSRIGLLPFDISGGEVPQWVDVWVDDRDGLHDFLVENGIQPRKFWFPLHTQAPYKQDDSVFPAASLVGHHAMWLPSALTLTESDVQLVCQVIDEWLSV